MVCQLPLFYPPPELMEANSSSSSDDDSAAAAARGRRRRDTDSVGSGSTLLSRLWNVVQRTASWWRSGPPASSSARRLSRHKRAPVASVSNVNVSMKVYLGFIMDKLTSLRNISKTKPNLRLELIPFRFKCDDTPVDFDPTVNQLIKIKVVCVQF